MVERVIWNLLLSVCGLGLSYSGSNQLGFRALGFRD